MRTADLIDHHAAVLTLMHRPWRRFGTRDFIAAPAQTLNCFEDNTLVRAQFETPGEGRVLVVDAGGSTRVAMVGDNLAALAIENNWAGIIVDGAVRDSADISAMDTLVYAIATSPVKSAKDGFGTLGAPIVIGGATVTPGTWVYADADGVLVSAERLV